MNSNQPLVIAQIVGKWFGGGVESVIMNYYRHIDRSKIQFDFICDEDSTNIPYKEINELGGKVIICPDYKNVFRYEKFLIYLFKKNKYKIVHSHINTLSLLPLRAAKKAGVPIRIAHSHSTSSKKEFKKTLIKNILRPFSKLYSNNYFACSELAGRWLFGNKTFDSGKVIIINNAVELKKFEYNANLRNEKRRILGIKDTTLVIGHIGRFVTQKNHEFLINIFNELHKLNNDSLLLLIGQGPLQEEIKNIVHDLKLNDSVIFLGQREDVNEIYNVMDIFVFPSFYEGLGMVLIESQINGLNCIASTNVPKNVDIIGKVDFLSLSQSPKIWANYILSKSLHFDKNIDLNLFIKKGYSIIEESKKLEILYYKILEETYERQ